MNLPRVVLSRLGVAGTMLSGSKKLSPAFWDHMDGRGGPSFLFVGKVGVRISKQQKNLTEKDELITRVQYCHS